MKARIYKPSKAATQSGLARTEGWMLEYELDSKRVPEPLMGWTASADTMNQVRMRFPTLELAKEYAQKHGLEYTVQPPHKRIVKPRNYADNFKYLPEEADQNKRK